MRRMGKYDICLVFVIFLSKNSLSILWPYSQQAKIANTSGIETIHSRDDVIITSHNYSKVVVNGYPTTNYQQYVSNKNEDAQQTFHVYNGHSYGPRTKFQSTEGPNSLGVDRTIHKRKIHKHNLVIHEKCTDGMTGQFVYYLSCNQFLNCWKGKGTVQNCSPGTLFNPQTLECDFINKVECLTGPRQSNINYRIIKPINQAACPEAFSGLIPNYTDCSKFINCNNGHGTSMDCAPGTLFDTNRNLCNYPENVKCFGDSPYDYFKLEGSNHYAKYGAKHTFHINHQNEKLFRVKCNLEECELNRQNSQYISSGISAAPPHLDEVNYSQQTRSECNSQTENCNQRTKPWSQHFHKIIHGQHLSLRCNPQIQDCTDRRQDYQYTQIGTRPGSRLISSQTQPTDQYHISIKNNGIDSATKTSSCDPQIQACTQVTTSKQIFEQFGHGNLNINPSTNEQQPCLNQQNCQRPQKNFQNVCNINDLNCRHQLLTVTGKIAYKETPKCPLGYQGILKHPFDCQKFLNCANGQTFIQDCAPGTLFNAKIGNCDFPHNSDCNPSEPASIVRGDLQNSQESYIGQGQAKMESQNEYVIGNTNRGQTGIVIRPTTEQRQTSAFDQINNGAYRDHVDIYNPSSDYQKHYTFRSTTTIRPVTAKPTSYQSIDPSADYIFEYDNGEPITLEPENVIYAEKVNKTICGKDDFYCSSKICISKSMVCDGQKDCDNNRDEMACEEYIGRFTLRKNSHLDVLENQRWINVSHVTCALLCIENTKFNCRSFNYRKIDKICFLSDLNVGLTGALRTYYPFDYYELKAGTIACWDNSKYFECNNHKCITKQKLCDGIDDCGDRQDEKQCNSQSFGYVIKLAGSKADNEGRIEITAFGRTGYICDDQFNIIDANVVCKELGFEMGALAVKGHSYFAEDLKENNTLYMMDDIHCLGNESSIIDCNFGGWGVHNCRDQEIAGVICRTSQETCAPGQWKCDKTNECLMISFLCDGLDDCSDASDESPEYCEAPSQIRLVNGTRLNEGRLEISHFGVWGTVCDDDFNEDAAKVICKGFGYNGKVWVKKEGYFGSGKGPIWLDQVSCFGNESKLEDCTHWDWGVHNCDHSEDVGIVCTNEGDDVPAERHYKYSEHFVENSSGFPNNCGYRKDNQFLQNDLIHARVVSGFIAKKGDYPWQAAIRVKAKDIMAHWCGAVIISSKWVLTAAHCLQGYAKGAYIIIAGEYNIDEDEGTEQQKYIDEYFIHEKFRKGHKMNNDIALVRLKGNGFILDDSVQPICLPDANIEYDDIELNCTISGFGSVKSGNSAFSHNMMAAWVPVHSRSICQMPHVYGDTLTDGMICAGSLDGGVDACDGDSGGPLACLDRGKFTLYGLTSWGHHCGYANKPGVYVKVAHYRKWIDNIIEKHSK